ncbi:hypothetical protein SEA_BAZZLE_60 [Mycobacterium phage Bazzle]
MENPELGTVLIKDFTDDLGPGHFDLFVYTERGWLFVDQAGIPSVNVAPRLARDHRLVQLHPKVSED